MIELIQFDPGWKLPNISPFCLKLETYFKLANVNYQVSKLSVMQRMKNSPSGKLPYIIDEGKKIFDSQQIIEYLRSKYDIYLDGRLAEKEKALSVAWRNSFEESLYWVIVYSRWMEEENWKLLKAEFFKEMPPVIRSVIPEIIRKQVKKSLYLQGILRHNPDDIYSIGIKIVEAFSMFLDNKKFSFGDEPTSLDATIYGFLANIIWTPIQSPLKERTLELSNCVDFCGRIKKIFI